MKNGLLGLAQKIVLVLASLMLLFLTITSTIYLSDGYVVSANVIKGLVLSLLGVVLVALVWGIAVLTEKLPKKVCLTGLVLLFASVLAFCAWWIKSSANLPQSDEKSIYDIAVRAMNHDLLPIAPTGSYMSLWPFQAGLVLFEETILRLIPNADEMTIQWIYMPLMALSLVSAYMVVRKLFADRKTRSIWCILMSLCIPYYFYINNMYGEVPSMALLFLALWMLLEYLQKNKNIYLIFVGISAGGAIAVRKNTLIFVIACCLVLLTLFLAEKKKQYLLVIVVLIFATILGTWFPRAFYERRAHNTMGEGVPAISYIAMGLQWNDDRDAGGWNGYHSDLYMKCDYNAELTAEISRESVRESLGYMMKNPGYLFSFYYHKLTSQWTREDYGCLYSTLDFYGDRTAGAWEIYQGKAKDGFMNVMSMHQSVVFLGAFIYSVWALFCIRKKEMQELPGLILLVTFIGGFLFSMLWEAGSRYVMPYVVMLIPYAAEGYRLLFEKLKSKVLEEKRKK